MMNKLKQNDPGIFLLLIALGFGSLILLCEIFL
jgi:hypothetical protein